MNQFHKLIQAMLILVVGISSASWSQETYVNPEALDIDTIKDEEMMGDSSEVTRIYIFLAIWNSDANAYLTFVTDGKSDMDGDGSKAYEEPNDLHEYKQLMHQIDSRLQIEGNSHTSYINSMPNFSELFPGQNNPFDLTDLVEVETEETFEDENRLQGSKTISVHESGSGVIGVERFIAFYNLAEDDEEEGPAKNVNSYGFASVQIVE